MAPATRTQEPRGRELDKRLDAAFGEAPAIPLPAEQPKTLDEALAWLQRHLPRVGRDAEGELQFKDRSTGEIRSTKRYHYADLADVTEAVLPLLGALGLSWRCKPTLAQLPGETGYRFVLEYRLRHVSGDEETGVWPLPDRADPQVVGSHITYGRRYCLCAVTGLAPGGDDEDGGGAAADAAKRGDTLSEASLSLPPAESDRLVAALEPAAETPLVDYPTLWAIVVKRRAAAKDSPIEHDSVRLTWGQLFGFSLAQRIDLLTAATYRAFFDAARTIGTDALPWLWDNKSVPELLTARRKAIEEERHQRAEVLALAIASAETADQLTAAGRQLAEAHAAKEVTDERRAELLRFYDQRVAALARTEPVGEASAEGGQRLDEAVAAPDGLPWAKTVKARELADMVWRGTPVDVGVSNLDGAWERGEISADEHALLTGMIRNRPGPVLDPVVRSAVPETLVPWLEWQVGSAVTVGQLDTVRDRLVGIRDSGALAGGPGTPMDRLCGMVDERRKLMVSGRYR